MNEVNPFGSAVLNVTSQANNMATSQICILSHTLTQALISSGITTLQSMMNAKLSPQRFWPCREYGLIKTIQMIPHNLSYTYVSSS